MPVEIESAKLPLHQSLRLKSSEDVDHMNGYVFERRR